jgi:hypothetical protein
MKRLQISLEPELDAELGRVAQQQGVSKAEVVRRVLRSDFAVLPSLDEDPLVELFGTFDGGEPSDSELHDAVIYGST